MEDSKEKYQKIKSANQTMLDYFNKAFLAQLEDIQNLKTQIFEIDIKIDELDKTKDIYAFKSNSRKSVFSPVTNDGVDTERNKIIQEQIKDLQSVKETLTLKLRSMELQLNKLRQYLEALNDAEDALSSFEPRFTTDDPDHTDNYGFTFLQDDAKEDISAHGYNILMLDAYDRALTQTILDKNIRTGLESIESKLDMINYLIGTDVGRAKLTIQEILHNTKQLIHNVDDMSDNLNRFSNSNKPLKEQLEIYLNEFKQKNPKLDITASVETPDAGISYHPVFNINFMRLIQIFFDNIAAHADASKVTLQASLMPNTLEVILKDDGVGIKENFMTDSPWYSSLHKAKEILYMLCGRLDISGDAISGTTVKFSFPIQQ
ncbi:MAG: hypothetical protein SO015_09610 [Wujia sp.]|nr:hypothetical protein [Wujia sp.]MDY3728395.1 hypothetical protein [Wujia sp.]